MSVEHRIRAIGEKFVLNALVSALWVTRWLLFTTFVGVDLGQSALTRCCLIEKVLDTLGGRGQVEL